MVCNHDSCVMWFVDNPLGRFVTFGIMLSIVAFAILMFDKSEKEEGWDRDDD
jgi:hypothetical protein